MKALRPRIGGAFLALGWFVFLVDRWMLPQGPFPTELWLTIIGAGYLVVAVAAMRRSRKGSEALPWATMALGVWGVVTLVGLSSDTSSSRAWMWASLFSLGLGTVVFLVTMVPLDRRPAGGVVAYLVATLVFGGAGVAQVVQCRTDLHASWCDPRYEQEERILATLDATRGPERSGHFGGPLTPATASYLYPEVPDPLTAVIPRSASGTLEEPGRVRWEFGGHDDACVATSLVQPAVGGYELRISVDCR